RAPDAALLQLAHERALVVARRRLRELLLGDDPGGGRQRERLAFGEIGQETLDVFFERRRWNARRLRRRGRLGFCRRRARVGGRRRFAGAFVFACELLLPFGDLQPAGELQDPTGRTNHVARVRGVLTRRGR